MNRYDYYTRCTNFDEQEWLTEELSYPENEDTAFYEDDTCHNTTTQKEEVEQ